MKKRFFSFLMVSFCFLGNAQLTNVTVDETPLSGIIGEVDLTGYTNYRLFAEATFPTDRVDRVLGNSFCPLDISSDVPFFISSAMTFAEPKGENINPGFFGFLPDAKYSSTVTIGTGAAGFLGVLTADDTDGTLNPAFGATDGLLGGVTGTSGVTLISAPGENWWPAFQATGANIDISTVNGGSWFTTGGTNTLGVGVNNSVMLGSFTTNGSFSYNISVGTQETGGNSIDYFHCENQGLGLSYPSSNCTAPTACNYNEFATQDDGSCFYIGDQCDDYNETTINDIVIGDCNCEGLLLGCMDNTACNYNDLAMADNGTCVYPSDTCNDEDEFTINDVYLADCSCAGELDGCSDLLALNYDVSSTGPCNGDNSCCIYNPDNDEFENATELVITPYGVCNFISGTNVYASDSDQTSTENLDVWYQLNSSLGCIEVAAESAVLDLVVEVYDASLTLIHTEDATFIGSSETFILSVQSDENYYLNVYDSFASAEGEFSICVQEMSLYSALAIGCLTESCTDSAACNYDPAATEDNGTCYYTGDLCDDFDDNTTQAVIQASCLCQGLYLGCMDALACNYDSEAEVDNETCVYIGGACNDGNSQTIDDVYTSTCQCEGTSTVNPDLGCIDTVACNYNAVAIEDDGTCVYPGEPCDDGNFGTQDEVYQPDCSCQGNITGCTDSAACNYNPIATIDSGNCTYTGTSCSDGDSDTVQDVYNANCTCVGLLAGCTDSAACNYNSLAQVDNGNCRYQGDVCNDQNSFTWQDAYNVDCNCVGLIHGCMDSMACNFNSVAELEDNTCQYSGESCAQGSGIWSQSCDCEYFIEGFVFIDNNFNGTLDGSEVLITNHQVTLSSGEQVFTNGSGYFIFTDVDPGSYFVTVNYQVDWDIYTTPVSQSISAPTNNDDYLYFGVTNTDPPSPSGTIYIYSDGEGVPCNDIEQDDIHFRNTSPYPISGVIKFEFDELYSFLNADEVVDSIVGNSVYTSYSNLGSYQYEWQDVNLNTPSEEFFGLYVHHTATIYAWYEGELIELDTDLDTQEVTCAYDPNDITGYPYGYTDDHLVLADTRMEYTIRFQNTGNAPAETVLIVDTLDVDMDQYSFELVAYTHDVMTSINSDGRLEFLFQNINLPDSTENLEESQGLVTFKIDFKDDIEIEEEVNQTAYIYFDNNPAIVTNTTWHTIHECGGESVFELAFSEICEGEEIALISSGELVETVTWTLDNEFISNELEFSQVLNSGEHLIVLEASNPLCVGVSEAIVSAWEMPDALITEDGALLTASEGTTYQWYLNGEEIEGATNQSLKVMADGLYSVEVTNENDCSTTSEETMIVSVSELRGQNIKLYPNPMSSSATLELGEGAQRTVTLTDMHGKTIKEWKEINSSSIEITRESLPVGNYTVSIYSVNYLKSISLIIR